MNASAPQIPRMLNNNQYLIIEILVQSIQHTSGGFTYVLHKDASISI